MILSVDVFHRLAPIQMREKHNPIALSMSEQRPIISLIISFLNTQYNTLRKNYWLALDTGNRAS